MEPNNDGRIDEDTATLRVDGGDIVNEDTARNNGNDVTAHGNTNEDADEDDNSSTTTTTSTTNSNADDEEEDAIIITDHRAVRAPRNLLVADPPPPPNLVVEEEDEEEEVKVVEEDEDEEEDGDDAVLATVHDHRAVLNKFLLIAHQHHKLPVRQRKVIGALAIIFMIATDGMDEDNDDDDDDDDDVGNFVAPAGAAAAAAAADVIIDEDEDGDGDDDADDDDNENDEEEEDDDDDDEEEDADDNDDDDNDDNEADQLVLELVVAIVKETLATKDDNSNSIVVESAREFVVAALVHWLGSDLMKKDDIQRYCLVHRVCQHKEYFAEGRFHFLIECDPSSLFQINNDNGDLPLHYVHGTQTIRQFQVMIDAYFRYVTKEKVICLLFQKNNNGNTPFQLACHYLHERVTDVMVHDAVEEALGTNRSFPSLDIGKGLVVAATNNNIALDGVYYFIRRQPNTMLNLLQHTTSPLAPSSP